MCSNYACIILLEMLKKAWPFLYRLKLGVIYTVHEFNSLDGYIIHAPMQSRVG